jgi:hypothetical protein
VAAGWVMPAASAIWPMVRLAAFQRPHHGRVARTIGEAGVLVGRADGAVEQVDQVAQLPSPCLMI